MPLDLRAIEQRAVSALFRRLFPPQGWGGYAGTRGWTAHFGWLWWTVIVHQYRGTP